MCFWCGGPPAEGTRDHVFPRNLFLPSLENPITVPACDEHNRPFSFDEEYFRDFIVGGSWRHPEARRIWDEKSRHAFRRSRRYAAQTMSQVTQHEVRSPLGLFLGPLYVATPDSARIQLVFRKIIRGLYCHHFDEKRTLGPIELRLWQISPLTPLPPEGVRDALLRVPMRSLGHVQYRFLTVPDLEPDLGAEAIAMVSFFDRRMGFVLSASTSQHDDRLVVHRRPLMWVPRVAGLNARQAVE